MSHPNNMGHLNYLSAVADSDAAVLRKKESTYQGSWKAAGGRSAWFMLRRNMDRLLRLMAPSISTQDVLQDFQDHIHAAEEVGGVTDIDLGQLTRFRAAFVAEDVFLKVLEDPSGADGTVLACLRDLRRYALLVEAEMVSQGHVSPEDPGSRWTQTTEGVSGERFPKLDPPEESCGVLVDLASGPDRTVIFEVPTQKTLNEGGFYTYTEPGRCSYVCRAKNLLPNGNVYIDLGEYGGREVSPDTLSPPPRTEDLAPWAVSPGWLRTNLWSQEEVDRWYHQQAPDLYVLEPAVPYKFKGSPPSPLQGLYDVRGTWATAKIDLCPPDARGWFPRLHREVNTTERSELPVWQQALYGRFDEDANKWLLQPEHMGWAVE